MNIDALNAAVEHHSSLPFEWGKSDCFISSTDAAHGAHGNEMFKAFRKYKTEAGAYKALRKQGCETVADFFAKHLREIPPFQAQRGDLGTIRRGDVIAAGVFTSAGFAVKGENGMLREPVTNVDRAFTMRS